MGETPIEYDLLCALNRDNTVCVCLLGEFITLLIKCINKKLKILRKELALNLVSW